ncbi:MAG: beta strand repeat-containing protein [Limisphaerales bacterium]
MKRIVLNMGRYGTSVVLGMAGLMLMAQSTLAGSTTPLSPSTAQQYSAQSPAIPITINPHAVASPYADSNGKPNSTNIVDASVKGTVEKVSVTLTGFTHTYPNDVQVLLVGPNGNAVVLMANEGGGQQASGLTLTFDDYGTAASSTAPLANGYYAPPSGTILNSLGSPVAFPAPAPQAPYSTSLAAAFNGCPIAGTWSLYVVDDNFGSSGSIQSWTLNVWQAPAIASTSADSAGVTVAENGQFQNGQYTAGANPNSASFTVTVSDPTAAAVANLTVGATCNPSSLATVALTGGQGTTTQTLTVTPSNNQNGSGTITVFVTDASGASVVTYSKTIALTVTPVNQPPIFVGSKITKESDGSTVTGVTVNQAGISIPLQINLSDPDNAASDLGVQVTTTDNPEIVTPSGVMFDSTTAGTRNFTIVPNGTATGTAHLTFWVYDKTARTQTNSVALTVTVTPAAAGTPPMFAAPSQINLAVPGTAVTSLLPAIPSLNGFVSKLSVTLNGLVNVDPATLGVQLISPDGKITENLLQVADETGTGPFNFAQVTFSDSAPAVTPTSLGAPPANTSATIANIALQPDDLSASKFNGVNATSGQWTLKITGGGASGANAAVLGGWVLTIYAAPAVAVTSGVNLLYDQGQQGVTISYQVSSVDGTVTAQPVLNGLNANLGSIVASKTAWNSSTGVGSFVVNNNTAGVPPWGTNQLTIVATDNNGLVGTSVPISLGFEFVNTAPQIPFIPKQVTSAGVPTAQFAFAVSDGDYDPALSAAAGVPTLQNLTLTASSDTTWILPNENIILQSDPSHPDGRHWLMTLYPLAATAVNIPVNVTITVADNSSSDGPPANSGPLTGSTMFPLVVNQQTVSLFPPSTSTTKPTVITLVTPESVGNPYPATSTVSGLLGTVADVKVNLYGLSHYTPQDITLLLVHTDPVTSATKAVLLMQGAGGTYTVSSESLVFSDSAAAELPQGAQITSGVYKPSSYLINTTNVGFPPVVSGGTLPPASGYGTKLDDPTTGFFGMYPNGAWQLYAFESGNPTDKGGVIDQGWQLLITTAPKIQPVSPSPYVINEAPNSAYIGAPGVSYSVQSIPVVVGDLDPNVVVSAAPVTVASEPSGYNPSLLNTTITAVQANVAGSSANTWNLQINPPPFTTGTVTIQVTATDTQTGLGDTLYFTLKVQAATFPPVVSPAIPATFTLPAATPLVFTFNAYDVPNPNNITVSQSSIATSSKTLVPASNVSIVPGSKNLDGSIPFTVTVTPVGIGSGPVTISFPVTDTVTGLSAPESFTVTFNPAEAWINANSLTIPQGLPADGEAYYNNPVTTPPTGYPTTIFVGPQAGGTNVPGVIESVGVTVDGFNHGYPQDVDMLLVHTGLNPAATKAVLLMSHAGGGIGVSPLRLTFTNAQAGVVAIPQSGPLTSGVFSPAQYGSVPTFPNVSIPFGTDMTSLYGMDPNGEWDLYVLDDTFPTGGAINNGWFLVLETGPAVNWTLGNAISVTEDTTGHWQFDLSDQTSLAANLTVTPTVLADGVITNSDKSTTIVPILTGPGSSLTIQNVTGTGTGGASRYLQITPATDLPSSITTQNVTATVQLTVTDPANPSFVAKSAPLTVTVLYKNQPSKIVVNPSLPINATTKNPMVTVNENTATSLSFTIQDVDSQLVYGNLSVTSENSSIVPNLDMTKATVSGFNGSPSPSASATLSPNTQATVSVPLQGVLNAYNINFDGSGSPTLIDIKMNDGNGNLVDQVVEVYVQHVEQAPTLTGLPSKAVNLPAGGQYTLSVNVGSVEQGVTITANAVSSSQYVSIVPVSPITGSVPGKGAPGTFIFTVTSLGGQAATAYINFTLTDNSGQASGSASFRNAVEFVVAQPPGIASGNSTPIAVTVGSTTPAGATSSINISDNYAPGMYDVTVVIPGFTASDPQNVDLLLVGPSANPPTTTDVLLMSGAGGKSAVGPLQLGFDDGSQYPVLVSGVALSSSTNNPSDLSPTDVLASPAPARPYQTRLRAFTGVNPSGTWSLFVSDHGSGDTVSLPYGWTLVISTLPTLSAPAGLATPLVLAETQSKDNAVTTTLNFTAGEDQSLQSVDLTTLQVTATAAKGSSLVNVNVTTGGNGATVAANGNVQINITPVYLAAGSDTITITLTRPSDNAQAVYTLPVTITPANVPPTVSRIPNVSIAEGGSASPPVEFIVSDPDSPPGNLTITASVVSDSNSGLLANSGLTFTATGNNAVTADKLIGTVPNDAEAWEPTLNITPNPNLSGTATIAINVADAGSAQGGGATASLTQTFTVTVAPPAVVPAISGAPASVAIEGGVAYSFNVSVASANGAITSLQPTFQGKPISSVTTTEQGSGPAWTVAVNTLAVSQVIAGNEVQLVATDVTGAQSAVTTVNVTVVPRRDQSFTNANDIVINDFQPASIYPSDIVVPAGAFKSANISSVIVTLHQFQHTYPSDVGLLLVGPAPSDTPIVLMENASKGSVSGLELSFSATAVNAQGQPNYVPEFTSLQSATYVPANYKTSYVFPEDSANSLPASAGYVGIQYPNLASLAGQSPAGTWRLYVVDQVQEDVGAIPGGWSIDITTGPSIQFANATVSNAQSASAANTFQMIDDSQVPLTAGYYNFTVASSDTTIVPADSTHINIVDSGDHVNYTVYATPLPNKTSSSGVTITISGTDPDGLAFSGSFKATFTPYNAGPNITVANAPTAKNPLVIQAGSAGAVSFTFSDSQSPAAPLYVSVSSTNAVNIPLSALDLNVNYGSGSGTLQVAPLGNGPLTDYITLTVAETANEGLGMKTNSVSFPIELVSSTPAQANNALISIPQVGTASPDPAPLFVTNLAGKITKATVTLNGFTHTYPADVSVLLVGPNGQGVVLMSQAGNGAFPVSNVFLTFDDAAANGQLPRSGQIFGGTYAPSAFRSNPNFAQSGVKPVPPIGPYALTLASAFNGATPNGTWYLYVQDEAFPNGGWITNGWSLNLQTTGPEISPIAAQQVNENPAQPLMVSFSVASAVTAANKLTVTASLSGSSTKDPLATVGTPQLADSTGTNYVVAITPALNMPSAESTGNGTAAITITATDTSVSPNVVNTLTFPLTVVYEAQPPVISGLPTAPVTTPANQPLSGSFTAASPDLGSVVTATVTAQQGANIGTVTVAPNGAGSWTWLLTPNGTAGQNVVTVTASYAGYSVPATFTIVTTGGTVPTITGLTNALTVLENQVGYVFFNAGNLSLASVTNVVGTTDNTNLVAGVKVSFTGTNYEAAVSLVPYQNNQTAGAANVFVGVGDQFGTNLTSFSVTVIPVSFPPSIAPISDQYVQVGTPSVRVAFTVTDPAVPITSLTYTSRVSNTSIISAPITFEQSGPSSYTATIDLVTNVVGNSTITFLASDGQNTAAQAFALVVTAPPAPAIGPIADTNTVVNASVTVPLVVTSASTPLSALQFSYKLSNSNLVSSVVINTARFPVNGATAFAQIFPANNQYGTCVITIYVTDGYTTASQYFALTVPETAPVFAAIADTNAAVNTASVTVPLVVTPTSVPISGLTFGYKLSNSNLVSSVVINTVRFPVNGVTALAQVFPVSNQVGTCAVTIYVSDGVNTVAETFNFSVTAPVGPTLGAIADQTTQKNTPINVALVVTDPVTPLANLTFSTRSSNPKLVQSAIVVNNGTSASLAVNLVTNAYGAAVITVSVSDGFTTASQPFALLVLPTPPSLAPITSPVGAVAGGTVSIPLSVFSPDTPIAQLTFVGSSTNSAVVSGVSFSTSGTNVTATVTLAANAVGSAAVQIEVSDGYSTSAQSFVVNVAPAKGSTLSATLVGKVLKITFTGVPNSSYIIQGSSNLKTWSQVGSAITTDSNGNGEYDATVSSSGEQYFRALLQ